MKQLAMLVTAGVMAFMLSGCGEEKPKAPEVKAEESMTKPMNSGMQEPSAPMHNNQMPTPESTGTNTQE